MITQRLILAVAISLGSISLVTPVGQAFAHAHLKASTPKNGATVSAPKTLNIEFEHPARLTSLKLSRDGKGIPVTVDTLAPEAQSFAIPLPTLAPGAYQVKWASLGSDGHPMTGTFSFKVSNK